MKKSKSIFLSLISIITIGCAVPTNYKDICYVDDLEMSCDKAESYAKRIAYEKSLNNSNNSNQNKTTLEKINSFRSESVKVVEGGNSISVSPKTRILEESNLKNVISNEKDNIKIEVSKEMNIAIGGIIVSGKNNKLKNGLLMRVTKITENTQTKILEGTTAFFMEAFPECKILQLF